MISLPSFHSDFDLFFNATESTKLLSSYDVFHQIRQLTLNAILWDDLLKIANREILYGSTPSEDLNTSCIVSFCLLNMIFLGEKRAKDIMEPLTTLQS